MKRLLFYLPLHFVILIISGIIFQIQTGFWTFGFFNIIIVFTVFIFCLILIKNKIVITVFSVILFFFVGISTVYLNYDRNYINYYTTFLENDSSVVFKVQKVLKSNNYYDKYEVEVTNVDEVISRGRVLVNIKKDSLLNKLKVDDRIYAKPIFKALKPPLNPHQFDYSTYLFRQGIYKQVFLENSHFLKLKESETSLIGLSAKFRNLIQKSLKKHSFKKDELAVINALLLGQRQGISKELITNYANAGAIHILAVSGLHVGIMLLILTQFFKPLERLKKGKIIKTVLIVLFLWMFAFISGLSASVVRAVTMFTFLAIGQSFRRKNVVEFSLIASLFFLLIIKPMFLFDVGFQLSYLAVFGIVWLQPKLYELWNFKFKIIDKIWQLFSVSIAAQVGILPLSIYYFHQFPGLFMISNLVIVPFLGFILIGGVLVIILSLLSILPKFLVFFYGSIISWMNRFVSWISYQESFLIKEIPMSFLLMLSCYIFITFCVLFFSDRKSKSLLFFLISVLLIQGVFLFEQQQHNNKKELIVFHKRNQSIIGKRLGGKLFLDHNLDSINLLKENSLKAYRIAEGIQEITPINFNQLIKFSTKKILLIDSLGVYKINGIEKPIVLLQYAPKINLERVIKRLKPTLIIADGTNYKSYINKWSVICKQEKTPFHSTEKNGAYILRNKN